MRTFPNDRNEPDNPGVTGVGAGVGAGFGTGTDAPAAAPAAADTDLGELSVPLGLADLSEVTDWVAEDFGIRLTALTETDGGTDAAPLWHGVATDGAEYAVRLSDDQTAVGLLVPAVLARQGVPGVPAPVPTPAGDPWAVRGGVWLSLRPWLSGSGALDDEMTADDWRAYGALLHSVHTGQATPELARSLPRAAHADAQLLATVRAVEAQLARPVDELAVEAAAEWRSAAGALDRLLQAAAELAEEASQPEASDPSAPGWVVSHGDPHLGNVVRGTSQTRLWLTNWDDAVFAPREWDLMFVLDGGVLPFAPVTQEQQAWFFEGYGPVEPDLKRLARARVARALEDLAFPAAQACDGELWDTAERTEALTLLRWVLSPTGLVRTALESLDELGVAPVMAEAETGPDNGSD